LFKPERFLLRNEDGSLSLDSAVPHPRSVIYGYGRRMCPGKLLSEAVLFAAAVSIIATMYIGPPVDAAGNRAPMREERATTFLNMFKSFDCTIHPRDDRATKMIKEVAENASM
jgi:hypothetical protein